MEKRRHKKDAYSFFCKVGLETSKIEIVLCCCNLIFQFWLTRVENTFFSWVLIDVTLLQLRLRIKLRHNKME